MDVPANSSHDQSTRVIPLGNHVTQQKLIETENRSALTKALNFGIFRFIPLNCGYLGVIVSFRKIHLSPVYSGTFCSILFCSCV